jgi:serine protease Do
MNKFIRLLVMLAALGLAMLAGPAAAQTVSALFDQRAASVVDIHAREWVATGAGKGSITMIPTQGTGVLVSADGKVLTVAHVVQTADEIEVKFGGGKMSKAWVIASEPAADVALLQLERVPAGIQPAPLGNSDAAAIGESLFIIGAPYDLHPTLTAGSLGGRHQTASPFARFAPIEMFQTDAAIHPGSSGAPLFNMRGEVIGIATQILISRGQLNGLGFAVTANTARALLLERHSFWSGIGGYWVAGDLAMALNLPQTSGLLVQRIARDSPATRLKLQAGTAAARVESEEFVLGGDIILAMQGVSLAEEGGYQRARDALAGLQDGEMLRMRVLRAGRQLELAAPIRRAEWNKQTHEEGPLPEGQ